MIEVNNDLTFNCVICDFGFANFIGEVLDTKGLAAGLRVPETLGFSVRYAAPEVKSNTRAFRIYYI